MARKPGEVFPSDLPERTIKLETKIASDPDFLDNDLLASWIRIIAECKERRADLTDQWILVSRTDLCRIMGKGRFDVALTLARRLADVAEMSVELRGHVVAIHVRNYLRKQKLTPKTSGVPQECPGPSISSSYSQDQDLSQQRLSLVHKPVDEPSANGAAAAHSPRRGREGPKPIGFRADHCDRSRLAEAFATRVNAAEKAAGVRESEISPVDRTKLEELYVAKPDDAYWERAIEAVARSRATGAMRNLHGVLRARNARELFDELAERGPWTRDHCAGGRPRGARAATDGAAVRGSMPESVKEILGRMLAPGQNGGEPSS